MRLYMNKFKTMPIILLALSLMLIIGITGCQSALVQPDVSNQPEENQEPQRAGDQLANNTKEERAESYVSTVGATDSETTATILTSLEEAEALVGFSIALPTNLPDTTIRESIITFTDEDITNLSGEIARALPSVTITYIFDGDDGSWNYRFLPGFISLKQEHFGAVAGDRSLNEIVDGMVGHLDFIKTHVGDSDAVLAASFLPMLISDEDYDGRFVVNAHIHWFDGDMLYSLSVFAPREMFNYDSLIALAESVEHIS